MRVTTKGQVTIPKEIRDRLGIAAGSEVEFIERGDSVVIEKREEPTRGVPTSFDDWAASVAGTFNAEGMDGKEYIDWLRGPREDLDPR